MDLNMNLKLELLILKHKAKLNKLIEENAPYNIILKESQHLDKYIIMQMKIINAK